MKKWTKSDLKFRSYENWRNHTFSKNLLFGIKIWSGSVIKKIFGLLASLDVQGTLLEFKWYKISPTQTLEYTPASTELSVTEWTICWMYSFFVDKKNSKKWWKYRTEVDLWWNYICRMTHKKIRRFYKHFFWKSQKSKLYV